MKKLFVTIALASATLGVFAQGAANFQNIKSVTNNKRIYGLSSSNPTANRQGDAADYADSAKVYGTAYTAELWVQIGGGEWQAVAGSKVGFQDAPAPGKVDNYGILKGLAKVTVPAAAGAKVNLIIRVWDSSVASWADVWKAGNEGKGRGESLAITNYELGGDNNGTPVLQKSLIDAGLQSFGLYTVVPEPSVVALGALGLGALLLRRRK